MSATRRRDLKREQFWRETVAAFQKSGLSVRVFCNARDLSEASFYSWRRTLRKRDRQRPAARSPGTVPQPRLVPLRVVPDAVVEVVLPMGLIVRVPVGAEVSAVAALVSTLVAALRMPSC
jgi:transposase-like protein